MRRLVSIWKLHPVLCTLFLIAAAATSLFLIRSVIFLAIWSDPARRNQPIEPWMTPRYVGRSWDIPRDELIGLLGLPAEAVDGRRISLADIAAEAGEPVDALIARIEDHIANRPGHDP